MSVKNISSVATRFALLPVAFIFASISVKAQAPDTAKMARVMTKYKNENSVYINYSKKLDIRYEEGQLTATSTLKSERMLIGELSPAMDHYDNVGMDSYFGQLTQLDAIAYVPQKGGNYKIQTRHNAYRVGVSQGEITDASAIVTSFAGLTKGSIVKVTATTEHTDVDVLPTIYFESHYPMMHAEYEVDVPSFVNVKFVFKGENTSMFRQTKEEHNGVTTYKFIGDNIPGYKEFENVPSALYYIPHVVTYITSMRLPGQSADSVMLNDAEHLYKKLFKYVGYMNVKQDPALVSLVAKITKGDVTDRQKAQHLYQWVQQNMHYVALEIGLGGWVPREADTVCKRMYGDCKDMSSLLVQMGRMAGLKTHFAWIGTTDMPYSYQETPVLGVANHMICAVKLGNEWLFMDGTHANLPFGANRDDIQGKEALIAIDRDNFKIVTIPVVAAENNVTTDSTFIRVSELNNRDLEGRFKMKMSGYAAWNLGYALMTYTKEKDERERIVKILAVRGSDKFMLDNYKLKVRDTGNRDISISGNFTVGNYVHRLQKDVIINMNLLQHFEDDYIDTTDRKAAWYHDFKNIQKEVVIMEIPKDYKVSYLPKSTSGSLNDMWNYTITYKTDGKQIVLIKEYKLNTLAVSPRLFAQHNKTIAALQNQYKESVVLTAKKK